MDALTNYADSFVSVVQTYTPQNGSLSEQFNKQAPGNPISAYDLTWSYAAFVSMSERRAGQYPPGWDTSAAESPPGQCASGSVSGTYAPAVAAGAPDLNTTCTTNVLFVVDASTYYGENIYLVGNTTDLGAWDIDNAQPLSASNYTSEQPIWFVQVSMNPGETSSYVYARQQDCGQPFLYETTNRTIAVPECSTADEGAVVTRDDETWQGPTGTPGNCGS